MRKSFALLSLATILGSGERSPRRRHWKLILCMGMLAFVFGNAPYLKAAMIVGSADGGNCYPFLCNDGGTSSGPSIQYQQVYGASNFSGSTTITSQSFYFDLTKAYGGSQTILGGTYEGFLSTTTAPVSGLSDCLACNTGADNTEVFNFTIPAGGEPIPASGVFTINNTISSFLYNPLNGNLLLDITVTNQVNVPNGSGNSYFDADYTGQFTSRAWAYSGSSYGTADSGGLVTGFDVARTPEPASLMLIGTGLVGLATRIRRRRQSQS